MPLDLHIWAPKFGSPGGGIGAFSSELALALQAEGHRLSLWGKDDRDRAWAGMHVRGCGHISRHVRTSVFATKVVAGAFAQRPAAIISTHLNFGPAALAARRLAKVPYILIAHGIDAHERLSRSRRSALAQADGIWPVSSWTRERLLALGVSEGSVRIVGNSVDANRFSTGPSNADLARRYGLEEREKIILTVARLDPRESYKGYDSVIRALPSVIAEAGPVRYLVVGKGEDRARMEVLAAGLGVERAVTFCGFVPDDELAEHYRLADVFAMPSRGEGFGIVYLEAMASGIPVLAGNKDGSVDALSDGELGLLVDPGDDAAVTRGLIRLLGKDGPSLWFDAPALRDACLRKFGRGAFRERVARALDEVQRRVSGSCAA